LAENTQPDPVTTPPAKPSTSLKETRVVPATLREPMPRTPSSTGSPALPPNLPAAPKAAEQGTVVLDVEQGGVVVPSFLGKTVRSAIEAAEDSGLELDAIGSGIAREQSPPEGSHVPSGARIVVRFDR